MRAIAVLPRERSVRLLDVPAPRLRGDHDVLLQVLDVGVCGTDREICAFEYGSPPPGSDHLVLGHEALTEVVAVGPKVTRVRPGDLVVPMVRRPCVVPSCMSCRNERQDFCFTGTFTERGINGAHGFMTDQIVEHERWLHVLPRRLRDAGVLVEPLTIAEKALLQVNSLQARLPWSCPLGGGSCHRALVLGAGPVGLLGAMALVAQGFQTFVYARGSDNPARDTVLSTIGATFIPAEEVPPAGLPELAGSIDLVYEAMGASQTSFEVLQVLGTNGVFVFTGVPGRKAPVAIDTDALMRNLVLKNQIVLGTVNAGTDAFAAAVEELDGFVKRWPTAVDALITGRFAPEKHAELLLQRGTGIKNVISFRQGRA